MPTLPPTLILACRHARHQEAESLLSSLPPSRGRPTDARTQPPYQATPCTSPAMPVARRPLSRLPPPASREAQPSPDREAP